MEQEFKSNGLLSYKHTSSNMLNNLNIRPFNLVMMSLCSPKLLEVWE
jgi:hypothetical protein